MAVLLKLTDTVHKIQTGSSMIDPKKPTAILASLAVFRTFCDSGMGVYQCISEFANAVIAEKGLNSFTSFELTKHLNDYFEFSIPEPVVRTALKRISGLTLENHRYCITSTISKESNTICEKLYENREKNDELLLNLVTFTENRLKKKLSEEECGELIKEFCEYMLDDPASGVYTAIISSFVIEHGKHHEYSKQMDLIKEGVVLYSGIRFSSDFNNLGSWTHDMTFFLDTEILFDFAGYNGELRKSLFEDFAKLVNDANRKGKKIQLSIFESVKEEVERYFAAARKKLVQREVIEPFGAMPKILNGCKTPSDVATQESKFWESVRELGILIDTYNQYNHESNYKFNLLDADTVGLFLKDYNESEVSQSLIDLTKVYTRRRGRLDGGFDSAQYVLITFKNRTKFISFNQKLLLDSGVPLAVDLNFVVNKLWLKLGKSFGKGGQPKSFHAITKAQVVLSKSLTGNISNIYSKLLQDHKSGKINSHDAAAQIFQLRKISYEGEEITIDNQTALNAALSEEDLVSYIEKHNHLEVLVSQQAEKAATLECDLSRLAEDLDKTSSEHHALKIEAYLSSRDHITKRLEIAKTAFTALSRQIKTIDKQNKRWGLLHKIVAPLHIATIILPGIVYILLAVWGIRKFQWSTIAPVNFIVSSFLTLTLPALLFPFRKQIPTLNTIIKKMYVFYSRLAFRLSNYTPGESAFVRHQIKSLSEEIEECKAILETDSAK